MNDSILNTIKHMIGPDEGYDYFDTDLIVHINSVLFILNQLGVGPKKPFHITGDSETWSDFIDSDNFEIVKSYIYAKVKLVFDPPQSGTVMQALKDIISEFEWRANVATEE